MSKKKPKKVVATLKVGGKEKKFYSKRAIKKYLEEN